jgi:hypothetical protein
VIQDALSSFLRELVGTDPPIAYRWAGIFGLPQTSCRSSGACRDARAPGSPPGTPVTGTSSGSHAASSSRTRSSAERTTRACRLLDPARLLAAA